MNRHWFIAGLLGLALFGVAASAQDRAPVPQSTTAPARLPIEGDLPSLDGATQWLNPQPLTAAGLRGKVVLVDFWTYTCINWLRTLPYVRAWAEKYRDQGLVVIGVHTPEFPFEKDVANVRQAAKAMSIDYPIAIDSNYAIWRAFRNEYWPALYFIDAQGHIRHHQFGEGNYEESEQVLQQLLAEAGDTAAGRTIARVDPQGIEAAADWSSLKSSESYLGSERADGFVSGSGWFPNTTRAYSVPKRLGVNRWALSGTWTTNPQAIVLGAAGGRIAYRFHARDLHLVLAPSSDGKPVRFRVTLDGAPPGADHGLDVDAEGRGTVEQPRLYQLIRQAGPVDDRTFEIEFLDPGAHAYVFTFG